jgi:hypothetical protein
MFELLPWVMEHGLNLRLMAAELFSTRIGAFFGLDVIVSAAVVFAFVWFERRKMKLWWAPILATCAVGVSLGLPLALYLRESDSNSLVSS